MNKLTLHLIKGLTGIDIEELENHIDTLQTKNQQLSFLIKDANKESAYRRSQFAESQKQLVRSEENTNNLSIILSAQNNEICTLQKDLTGVLGYIAALYKQKQDLQNENQRIAKQIEKLHTLHAQLQAEKEAQDRHINELIHTVSAHSQLKNTLQDTEKEIEEHKEAINTQKQENDILQKEIKRLQDTAKQERINQEQAAKEWQEKHTALQQKFVQAEAEKELLSRTIDDLRQTVSQMKEEKEKIEESFSTIQKEQEETWKKEIVQSEQNARIQKQKNETLKKEIELLQDSLAQTKDTCQQMQKKAQEQQEECTGLQQKLSQAEAEKTKLNTTIAELQHSLQQWQEKQPPQPEKCTDASDSVPEEQSGSSLLQAYQVMKAELEKSTLHHPYTRITLASNGSQSIYESKSLQLKTELFTWGIEGKEVILDEPHFIAHDEIEKIEGIETPFLSDAISCDFSDNGNASEIAETLLMAICCYRPLHITYRDKNGRSSERNLYWICFQPQGKKQIHLPYEGLFNDMLEGEIDSDHILAMHTHHQEARVFAINQIQSIQVFDAFVTTDKGIQTLIDGLYTAVLVSQPEAADMIYQCLPEQFKQVPQVISRRAHYLILMEDYEKAMELYLSVSPETQIDKHLTWQQINGNAFNNFIRQGIESERFEQLKEALREEGWKL